MFLMNIFFTVCLGMVFSMTGSTGSGNSSWSIVGFLSNTQNLLEVIGPIIVVIIGLILLIAALVKIGKGLMGGGRAQTNWVLNILMFFFGGALCFGGGWNLVKDISSGGASTLEQLGTGTYTPTVIIMVPGVDCGSPDVIEAGGVTVHLE